MVPLNIRAAVLLSLSLSLPSAALAQEFTIRPGVLVPGVPGTFFENGAGAPSVTYNPAQTVNAPDGQYLMVFETRLPTTDPACPGGMWGIGAATSQNGLSWTVRGSPLITPTPDTWYSCVAAHPTIRVNEVTRQIIVWFKGEQRTDVCANGAPAPAWGCGRFTGIGAASVRPAGTLNVVTPTPILTGQNIGFPKQVQVGNEYLMTYEIYPNIHTARGTQPNGLTPDGPVLLPSSDIPWATSEYFNPAIACTDDPAQRYVGYFGGRALTGGFIDLGGLGRTESDTGLGWDVAVEPDYTWAGGSAFRHWDILRVNNDDYLMYFSELDTNGRSRIRVATTLTPNNPPTGAPNDPHGGFASINRKRCN